MNKKRISWLLTAVALPALAFGAMTSHVSAEEGLDPSKAKQLIDIALVIDDTVMDGTGWTVVRDDFTVTPLPNNASCNNSGAKLQALEKSLAGNLAAKGKMETVQDAEPGQAPMSVTTEIRVYKTATGIPAAFKDVKTIYGGDDLAKCFVSALETNLAGLTGGKVAPFFPGANDDPMAAAFSMEAKASQLVDPIRIEHYTFYEGNTVVEMTFVGPKTLMDKNQVQFLLELQAEALKLVSGY